MTSSFPATLIRLRQTVAKIEECEIDHEVETVPHASGPAPLHNPARARTSDTPSFLLKSAQILTRASAGSPTPALAHETPALAFGIAPIDTVLQGGLGAASLHEVAALAPRDASAATGFVLAMAARAGGSNRLTLCIQTDFAAQEHGPLYGPGCDLFGLSSRRLLILTVSRPLDALWAMEEALKSRALNAVIAELPGDGALADLTATRRLTLAARKGGGFGFLFRQRPSRLTSSAETRWEIASAPSHPDRFGGMGLPAFTLSLVKNRRGPTGQWTMIWNPHEHQFKALPVGVAETAFDRPDRTPLVGIG